MGVIERLRAWPLPLRIAAGMLLAIASFAAAAILWPAASAPLPDPRRDYVIRNVHVVDVAEGTSGPAQSVTIRSGTIAAISAPDAPAGGLPAVDGGGGYLLPGFWDMHTHSFQLSPQLHLPLFVANGVTGVRDMMGCPGAEDSLIACASDKRRWNEAVAAGRMAGPRIVSSASYYLEHPDLDAAAVTARAEQARAHGVDELKVYNRLSPAAYRQAAREAKRLGLRLVGHLPKAVSLEEALAAGQVSFEHAHLFLRHCFAGAEAWRRGAPDRETPTLRVERMLREHDAARCEGTFAAMKASGAWFVPTHVTREEDARAADPAFVEDPRLSYLDPLSRWAFRDDLAGTRAAYPGAEGERALRSYFLQGLRLTGAAHRAGVPVLVGTDTAIGGLRYHDELQWLVQAGLTPAEAIRAATLDAALYAGMEETHGTVAVGKEADLVLLAANPLEEIGNTRRITAVIVAGRRYDSRKIEELRAFTRREAARPANMLKLLWGFARSSVASDL